MALRPKRSRTNSSGMGKLPALSSPVAAWSMFDDGGPARPLVQPAIEPLVDRQPAAAPLGNATQQATLARLAAEVQRLESAGRPVLDTPSFSTGCLAMDACLPSGGYAPGSVIEYLRATSGCGATYLALAAAAAAWRSTDEKYVVIVDTHHHLYPPALLSHQIPLQRVVWVRPETAADAVWATDQALRTKAVAAVVADLEQIDERDARRLQLAAERGGGLGLLLRSLAARRMPSWAEVQWVVRSLVPPPTVGNTSPLVGLAAAPVRQLEVQLARVRGGKAGAKLKLNVDGVRGTLDLASREKPSHERFAGPRSRHAETAKMEQANPVRVAAQLASSTHSSRRSEAG